MSHVLYRSLILGLASVFLITGATAEESEVEPIEEVFAPDASDYPADSYGKVAVVQWAPSGYAPLSDDVNEVEQWKMQNRETLRDFINEAAENGAKLIITPEFGVVGYPDIPDVPSEDDNFQTPAQIAPYAETIPGPSTDFFGQLARQHKVYIHFGMAEKGNGTSKSKATAHNVVVVMNPDGEVETKYHKMALYQNESSYLVPGKKITVYDNACFGKVGIVICSDIYTARPMNDYAAKNLDVLALSTSWAESNTGWKYFTQGAQWVNAYLLAANQNYFPDSGVIEPDGKAQSHIRQTTGIAYGYLPLKSNAPGLCK